MEPIEKLVKNEGKSKNYLCLRVEMQSTDAVIGLKQRGKHYSIEFEHWS